jgi:hypothetical protein
MPSHGNVTVGIEKRTMKNLISEGGLIDFTFFDNDVRVDKSQEHDVKIDDKTPNTVTCYIEGRPNKLFGINIKIKVPAVPRGIPRTFPPPYHHISCMTDNTNSGPGRLA